MRKKSAQSNKQQDNKAAKNGAKKIEKKNSNVSGSKKKTKRQSSKNSDGISPERLMEQIADESDRLQDRDEDRNLSQNEDMRMDDQSEAQEIDVKLTEDTKGKNIKDMTELNKSYNATEKVKAGNDEKFYDQDLHQDNLTEGYQAHQEEEDHESIEGVDIFGNLIHPKKQELLTNEQILMV